MQFTLFGLIITDTLEKKKFNSSSIEFIFFLINFVTSSMSIILPFLIPSESIKIFLRIL